MKAKPLSPRLWLQRFVRLCRGESRASVQECREQSERQRNAESETRTAAHQSGDARADSAADRMRSLSTSNDQIRLSPQEAKAAADAIVAVLFGHLRREQCHSYAG